MLKQITRLGTIALLFVIGLATALIAAAWPWLVAASPYVVIGAVAVAALAAIAWLTRFAVAQWQAGREAIAGGDAAQLESQVRRAEAARDITLAEIAAQRAAWELHRDQMAAQLATRQIAAGLGLLSSMGGQNAPSVAALTGPAIKQAQAMLPPGPALELLEAIAQLENILIVGGKGTGKTTLMQWLAALRAELGRVLIFDSHAAPATWPAGDVIGRGRDYQTIWSGMLELVNLLDRRYQDLASGARKTGEFGRVTNLIDELTLLPGIIKGLGGDIAAYNRPILTEGRKVDLCAVWGVHSDRVDALGLKGAADLKECFDAVVYLKNVAGDRYALVDFGEGIDKARRYRLPGPFVAAPAPPIATVEPPVWAVGPEPEMETMVSKPADSEPTPEEQQIIFHYVDLRDNDRANFSYSEVARRALGSSGGRQIARIKETLEKYGIELV